MVRIARPATLFGSLLLALFVSAAWADPPFVPDEVIVKYKNNPNASERAQVRAQIHSHVKRKFKVIDAEVLHLDGTTVEQALVAARSNPKVEYAEANYRLHIMDELRWSPRPVAAPSKLGAGALLTPNDPLFPQMWQLENVGQVSGIPGSDIRAKHAWDVFTGDPNILIGVIDTGVDYSHPDLAANIWTNPGEIPGNNIDDDNNGYVDDVHGYDVVNNDGDPMDDHGHGTHTSGTIAARGNNGLGTVGVNWQAKIVAIKFLDASGSGSTEGAVAAIEYAIKVGVRLTSNSWGGGPYEQTLKDAIDAAGAAGQLFVAAAGNNFGNDNDLNPVYPASYSSPNIVAVAATDAYDQLAYFSNFGPTTVDIGAPGQDIISTIPGGAYASASGTSMATPHVAGTLALMFGHTPNLGPAAAKALLLAKVDPIPSMAGKVVSNGRLNAFLAVADADSLPPGSISDLMASDASSNAIRLSWTATGDDSTSGTAAEYDVRYSTSPITAGNFNLAPRLTAGVPLPLTAGSAQSFEAGGLAFSTTYYLALRALDEFGNAGPVSNVVSAATLGPPRIQVTPSSFHETLLTGQSVSRTLTLRNVGQGTLDYTIPDPEPVLAPQHVYPFENVEKGALDTRRGPVVLDHHGGPDSYGYRWIDSDDPQGPPFEWVNIVGSGDLLSALVGDEDVATGVPIGFEFPFYGSTFTSVNIAANGWLSFTSSVIPTYANQPLPNGGSNVPENLIAPFWADFNFLGSPRVYLKRETGRFIVSYVNVPHYSFGGYYTFQVILDSSGGISYQYFDLSGPTQYSTIGIQNATKDVGLLVAYNAFYAHPGLAVKILPPLRWLSVSPRSGRIPAGQAQDLDVAFDTGVLLGATYRANLEIASNDSLEPSAIVPAQLDVIGVPNISVSQTSFDLGSVFVGGVARDTLVISNSGTDSLRVSSITSNHPAFSAVPSSLAIGPFGSTVVQIQFSPQAIGPASATLTLTSNDPDQGSIALTASGAGVPPPDIAVSPDSFNVALLTGETTDRTLHFENHGTADLVVQVSVAGPAIASVSAARFSGAGTDASRAPVDDPGGGVGHTPTTAATLNNHPVHTLPRTLSGTYSGTYLRFGITNLGEIMPFQYPLGNEHLQVGSYISGYTVGFMSFGAPYVYVAGYDVNNGGMVAVGYNELVNTPDLVQVEVTATTFDSQLLVLRRFTFRRSEKYVHIETKIQNISGHAIDRPIFKAFADWDIDGDYQDDTWDYDPSHHMVWAADQHYAAIASAETPDVLDAFGWPDLGTYDTVVDYPSGPLIGFDGLEILHFALPNLEAGASQSINTAYCAADDLEELRRVVGIAVPNAGWLKVDATPFIITGGQSRDLNVTFDAHSLLGGDYSARILVSSNDPDESEIGVPAHLHVTGVPDIVVTPPSLSFGNVFVGVSLPETLVVANTGTDTLRISNLASNLGDYLVGIHSLTIGPFSGKSVPVVFTPAVPGLRNGSLTITSNDPDQPTLIVPLSGVGLVPPVAHVSPESLSVTLLTGQTAHRTLHLSNTGGSDLVYGVLISAQTGPEGPGRAAMAVVRGGAEPEAAGAAKTGSSGLAGAPRAGAMSATARHGGSTETGTADPMDERSWSTYARVGTMAQYTFRPPRFNAGSLPVVVQDVVGDGGPVDVDKLRGASGSGSLRVRLDLATPLDLFNFGGFLSLDTDQNRYTGTPPSFGQPGQDIGCEFEILMFGVEMGVVDLYRTSSGYLGSFPIISDASGFEFAIPLAALDGDDGTMDVTGVVGTNLGPTDWFPDPGHGTIRGTTFVSVSPDSGVVPAGQSTDLDVLFTAVGLNGGDYSATVEIGTNDPGPGHLLEAPVHLHVIGAPDLAVEPDSLDFGTLLVGQTAAESLVVTNAGTDPLSVTHLAVTSTVFGVADAAFTLSPGESRMVLVIFHPTTTGTYGGQLRISSNDPDAPITIVPLAGVAVTAPVIAVTPDSVSQVLIQGQTADRTLNIANHGGSTLVFDIPQPLLSATTASAGPSFLKKGQRDPRIGAPVLLDHGGPDGYGYRWIDSREAGGPTFSWIDITPYGTRATLSDDEDVVFDIPLGFNFPFYADSGGGGNLFSTVNIASNGWLSFNDSQIPSYVNQPLPSIYAPSNLVAPFWSDLDLQGAQRVYYYTDGVKFIVSWVNVQHYGGGGPYTFQAILEASGQITFQYLAMGDPNNISTIGIQNGFRNIGLTVAFDTPYIVNGLATRISPPSHWLSTDPTAGAVAAGGSQDVRLHFDAGGLAAGYHATYLYVRSNDPLRPVVTVPVVLRVVVLPDIDASPLSFGSVFVGASATRALLIANAGAAPLTLYAISLTGASSFSLVSTPTLPVTLAPHESTVVAVKFAPTAVCACTADLSVTSNDPDENPFHVAITGSGVTPAQIEVSPAAIEDALAPALGPTASHDSRTLTVHNGGGSPLYVYASLASSGASAATGAVDGSRPLERANRLVAAAELRAQAGDDASPPTGAGTGARTTGESSATMDTSTSWASLTPLGAVVPAGESALFTLALDAYGLVDGDYTATIFLSSNDVETPVVTVPVTLHVGAINATFDINPTDLNRTSEGRWVQGQLTLPAGWDPQAIVIPTVLVQNTIPVDTEGPISYTTHDVKYKFDRTTLLPLLPDGETVPVKIIGRIGDKKWFSALDLVRLHRAAVGSDPAVYIAGSQASLAWSDAKDYPAVSYDLWYSSNDGDNWVLVAGGLTHHAYLWGVPAQTTEMGRLELVGFDAVGAMGSWFSQRFRIVTGTTADAPPVVLPLQLALRNLTGNPAHGAMEFELALPARGRVRVGIYDVRGARVRELAYREFEPGVHHLSWDGADQGGRDMKAGVYFVRTTAAGKSLVTRIAMVR